MIRPLEHLAENANSLPSHDTGIPHLGKFRDLLDPPLFPRAMLNPHEVLAPWALTVALALRFRISRLRNLGRVDEFRDDAADSSSIADLRLAPLGFREAV